MTRRHMYVIILYILLALVMVSTVHAQSSSDLKFSDVVDALKPRSGTDLIWDIFLYLIFLVGFVNMFLISDKQLMPSVINIAVMGMAVISKMLVGDDRMIEPGDFPVLILNIGMFTLPLIAAGMLRAQKGKPPKALIPSIIMGMLGGGYFFLFWALEQRNLTS